MRFSTFFRLGLLLLSATVAFATPREHRGSYFSTGMGFAYTSFRISEDEQKHRYVQGLYETRIQKSEQEFSGWTFPTLNFRFGRSAGNAVAIYGDLNFAMVTGKLKSSKTVTQSQSGEVLSHKSKTWENVTDFFASAGVGVEVYPFRNPNSIWRGFHFGNTLSFGTDVTKARDNGTLDNDLETTFYYFSGFLHTNLGMDWWVSDTWSLGVELSYTVPYAYEKKLKEKNTIQLLFRITRG